jgi:hypothetical protein
MLFSSIAGVHIQHTLLLLYHENAPNTQQDLADIRHAVILSRHVPGRFILALPGCRSLSGYKQGSRGFFRNISLLRQTLSGISNCRCDDIGDCCAKMIDVFASVRMYAIA